MKKLTKDNAEELLKAAIAHKKEWEEKIRDFKDSAENISK